MICFIYVILTLNTLTHIQEFLKVSSVGNSLLSDIEWSLERSVHLNVSLIHDQVAVSVN